MTESPRTVFFKIDFTHTVDGKNIKRRDENTHKIVKRHKKTATSISLFTTDHLYPLVHYDTLHRTLCRHTTVALTLTPIVFSSVPSLERVASLNGTHHTNPVPIIYINDVLTIRRRDLIRSVATK